MKQRLASENNVKRAVCIWKLCRRRTNGNMLSFPAVRCPYKSRLEHRITLIVPEKLRPLVGQADYVDDDLCHSPTPGPDKVRDA